MSRSPGFEEVIDPARAADHPRLAFLYVIASAIWVVGRIDDAVGYADASRLVIADERGQVPFGIHGWPGSAYSFTGQPERAVEWYRAELARNRDAYAVTRSCLVIALGGVLRSSDEAIAASTGLIEAAEATHNPYAISFALNADGLAFRVVDPDRARAVLRRGLEIAQDNGIRAIETHLGASLAYVEARSGDPLAALEYFTLAMRNYFDAGNTSNMRSSLATLAALLDRLGRHEPAATVVGFAMDPQTSAWVPEIHSTAAHVRDLLGDEKYEFFARVGDSMTTSAMATYAFDQIDQAQTQLKGN